jgi:hypothetical protein
MYGVVQSINTDASALSIRSKVEHPFRIIKQQFGFVKARYKGLAKNDNQLAMLHWPIWFELIKCCDIPEVYLKSGNKPEIPTNRGKVVP